MEDDRPKYTDEQLKEFGISPDDFCGPPGGTTGQRDEFAFQCMRHDLSYQMLKDGDPEHQRAVDEEFLQNMKNYIKRTGKRWLYPKAYAYYFVTRIFGHIWWNQKKKQSL